MDEECFADYMKDVAAKFGFEGVKFDDRRHAIVFPAASEKSWKMRAELGKQPAAFFAFLAGSLTVGTKHFTLEQGQDKNVTLRVKGSNTYEPVYLLSHRDAMLERIDQVNRQADAPKVYRDLIKDFSKLCKKYRDRRRPSAENSPANCRRHCQWCNAFKGQFWPGARINNFQFLVTPHLLRGLHAMEGDAATSAA